MALFSTRVSFLKVESILVLRLGSLDISTLSNEKCIINYSSVLICDIYTKIIVC